MERRNAWLSYKEAEETEMEKLAKAYREFLDKGKTERECVAEIVKEAEAAGYESLESKLEKGEKIKACHAWCCCKEGRKHCGDQHW